MAAANSQAGVPSQNSSPGQPRRPAAAQTLGPHSFQQTVSAQPIFAHQAGSTLQPAGSLPVPGSAHSWRQLSTSASASSHLQASAGLSSNVQPGPQQTGDEDRSYQQAHVQPGTEGVSSADSTSTNQSTSLHSLYAGNPPGRPPGRRIAIVRWVLNQRALWRDEQLTPHQLHYITALGKPAPCLIAVLQSVHGRNALPCHACASSSLHAQVLMLKSGTTCYNHLPEYIALLFNMRVTWCCRADVAAEQ